jgi:hypothetical protein
MSQFAASTGGASALVSQILQQERGRMALAAAAEEGPANGQVEEPAPELMAFLDDLLAKPQNSIFAPPAGEDVAATLIDANPPPFRPLNAQLVEPEPSSSSSRQGKDAYERKPSHVQGDRPPASDSYNSAEERRKAVEAQMSSRRPDKYSLTVHVDQAGRSEVQQQAANRSPNRTENLHLNKDTTDGVSSSGSLLVSTRSHEVRHCLRYLLHQLFPPCSQGCTHYMNDKICKYSVCMTG